MHFVELQFDSFTSFQSSLELSATQKHLSRTPSFLPAAATFCFPIGPISPSFTRFFPHSSLNFCSGQKRKRKNLTCRDNQEYILMET